MNDRDVLAMPNYRREALYAAAVRAHAKASAGAGTGSGSVEEAEAAADKGRALRESIRARRNP